MLHQANMSSNSDSVLASRDTNIPLLTSSTPGNDIAADGIRDVKSMEYHRQVLQSRMEEEKQKQYISPSDNIMSPCTAKLNAFRSKQAGKAKPKTLFMHASSKRLDGGADDGIFRSTANTTITRSDNSQPSTANTTKDSSI